MHHSLQIMFVLPLMTGHPFLQATILGGFSRGVPLCFISRGCGCCQTVAFCSFLVNRTCNRQIAVVTFLLSQKLQHLWCTPICCQWLHMQGTKNRDQCECMHLTVSRYSSMFGTYEQIHWPFVIISRGLLYIKSGLLDLAIYDNTTRASSQYKDCLSFQVWDFHYKY